MPERYKTKRGEVRWLASYRPSKHGYPYDKVREKAESREDALDLEAQRRREMRDGTWQHPDEVRRGRETRQGLTMGELFDRFMREYDPPVARDDTYYEMQLRVLRRWFGDMPVSEVTPEVVRRFRDERLDAVKTSTVKKNLITLSTIYTWAQSVGLATDNPATGKAVRRPRDPRHRTHYLTDEQETELRRHSPPWFERILVWALNSGMDRGEIIRMTWSQVDEASGSVWAPRLKTGIPRTVKLNNALRDVLAECKRARVSISPDAPVFLGPDKRPLTDADMKNWQRRVYRAAGIEMPGQFKTLRHTFASRLAMSGVDMRTIAELMGHSVMETTRRYAHLSPEHLTSAASLLDAWPTRAQSANNENGK
jgi:integrase